MRYWIKKQAFDSIITVGADPEFVLLNGGKFLYAGNIASIGFDRSSELGHDGPCAEIRPVFSNDSDVVCNDIRRIIDKYSDMKIIEKLKWIPASYTNDGYRFIGVGGHIHFGLPEYITKIQQYNHDNPSKAYVELFTTVTKLLDYYIAIPLIELDSDTENTRRTQTRFGQAGDFRYQPHGFEWRTLSGMWLADPTFAYDHLG